MRQFGDLLKELGFNPDAPVGTQKAFFRHLLQHADTVRKQNLRQENSAEHQEKQNITDSSTQLSFDPKILGLIAK